MHFRLKIGLETYSLDATPLDHDHSSIVTSGDRTRTVSVRSMDANQLTVRVDEQTANISVATSSEGTWVWADGRPRFVRDADKAERRRSSAVIDQPTAVTPPTPATVMRVMVEAGQEVEKGQACVVISAMKMELTLAAPYAGTVISVNTEAGAKVMPGDILVDIEPLPEADADE